MKKNLIKQKKWDSYLKDFNRTTDTTGRSIDSGIKDAVIAMNLLSFRTMGSCQGHTDERILFPYIYCEIGGEPKYHYKGEKEARKKIMKKYHINDWNAVYYKDEIWNYYKKQVINSLPYSNEYEKWAKMNEPLGRKMKKLVEKFNKKIISNYKDRIHVVRTFPGYRIESISATNDENYTKSQKKKLVKYSQKEFEKFTRFLKEKFFNSI